MFGINYFFTRRYKLLSGSLKLIVHSLTYSDLTCKSVSITVIVFLRCLYGRAVSNSQSPWRRLLLLAALCIFVCSCLRGYVFDFYLGHAWFEIWRGWCVLFYFLRLSRKILELYPYYVTIAPFRILPRISLILFSVTEMVFFFSPGAATPIGGCILQPSSGL